ncbi:glycoside hydrolase family 16 protein [Cenococcum geophilum]
MSIGLQILESPSVLGAYTLKDNYTPSSFFSMFNLFTATDPTNATAASQGLISSTASSVYIGVDHSNAASSGRSSIRIQSKNLYTHGLFILDFAHMPGSICGTWPSFWTYGSQQTWPFSCSTPVNGEIVTLGVRTQAINSMALHTADGCTTSGVNETGTVTTSNCYVNAAGQSSNAGCGVASASASFYGAAFNAVGGDVFCVKIWYFPHTAIPSDITSGSPNPNGWELPQANFAVLHQIVFDLTFCGDWADSRICCKQPTAFAEAYWRINSLKVYQSL